MSDGHATYRPMSDGYDLGTYRPMSDGHDTYRPMSDGHDL
jgi:hypothetical protein